MLPGLLSDREPMWYVYWATGRYRSSQASPEESRSRFNVAGVKLRCAEVAVNTHLGALSISARDQLSNRYFC